MDRRDDTREQRLAAKLRENLKRRKEQARARQATPDKPQSDSVADADGPAASLNPKSDSDS